MMYLIASYDKTLKCFEDNTKDWVLFSDWNKAFKYCELMNKKEMILDNVETEDELDIIYVIRTLYNVV